MKTVAEIVARVRDGNTSDLDSLSDSERRVVDQVIHELSTNGKSKTLEALWEEDFERRPVSIDEFLDNDYYLGEVGKDIYPKWREELRLVCDPTKEIYEWIIRGCIGAGKCLGRGAPVLMFDSTIKQAEQVKVGDLLMGDDSTPRTVLSVCSGIEQLYKVEQKNGDDYIVNKSHILSLKLTPRKSGNNHKNVDISVSDYLASSDRMKCDLKGYKVPVDWPYRDPIVDPYFVGLWVGDGSFSHGLTFSVGDDDEEIVDYLEEFCSDNGFVLTKHVDPRAAVSTYRVALRKGNAGSGQDFHWVIRVFKELGLIIPSGKFDRKNSVLYRSNKCIPKLFYINDKDVRLQFLAGLLDADGWYDSKDSFEVCARHSLAPDIVNLARSLGFKVTTGLKEVITVQGKRHSYTRIGISGNVSRIPCKLPRKWSGSREINKDPLVYGVKVSSVGEGEYFGFEIDGNGRFLLGDFTVTHNTTQAVLALLHRIQYLCCLRNPQRFYHLATGSPIVFGFFNIFKYLAQDTSYKYFANWIKMSPFFQDEMRKAYMNERTAPGWLQRLNRMYGITDKELANSYMRFPKGITIALGSNAIHALGQNLYGGLLDETDMVKNKSIRPDEKGQVEELYGQAKSRLDSRFIQRGGVNPGILILVSQVQEADSFLSKHVEKVSPDKRTYVSQFAIWEIKAIRDEYTNEWEPLFPPDEPKFQVVVGTRNFRSFIVRSDSPKIPDGARVIDVPESLRPRFEYSVDDGIRDQAGIPTYGANLFLPRRDKLFECYERAISREHPFTIDTITLSIETEDQTTIADFFVKEACMDQRDKVGGTWTPRWFPCVDRAVHVDLAVTNDCAGLAMGCIGDIKRVQRFDIDGRPYWEQDYSIFMDFVLRIKARQGSEIDFSKMRQFIFYLHAIGFPIRYFSCDGFMSVDTQQAMKKAGFDTKILSMDKKPIPYNYFRSAIYETRFDMYEYEPLTEELTKLQDHSMIKGRKPPIDHPPKTGSKDCSDAAGGVVARLAEVKNMLVAIPTSAEIKKMADARKKVTKDSSESIKNRKWLAEQKDRNAQRRQMADLFKEDER